jgi:hypothetical protein
MKGENNADLIKQMRILQELFYDVTDNDLFARTNEIIQIMEMASKTYIRTSKRFLDH